MQTTLRAVANSSFEVHVIKGPDEWELVRRIRHEVFVIEQACPPEEEWDVFDAVSRHYLGSVDAEPIAAARRRTAEHEGRRVAKLERFAVLEPFRGRGFGVQLVRSVMADAAAAGFSTFYLHAQAHLAAFYAALGFVPVGEPFVEAGIPHIAMVREGGDDRQMARIERAGDAGGQKAPSSAPPGRRPD